MSKTSIEWSEKVWNPVTGCDKVSPGCDNCYALTMSNRNQHNPKVGDKYAGTTHKVGERGKLAWTGKINLIESALGYPLTVKKPSLIFVNSMSDLFHDDVPFEFIDKVFTVMALCDWHTYQILTKRPDRMAAYFRNKKYIEISKGEDAERVSAKIYFPFPNVWLMTSVEDQKRADERISYLLQCPAAVRGLSIEPLLEAIDLKFPTLREAHEEAAGMALEGMFFGMNGINPSSKTGNGIHWIICGGESGPGARPMHPDWVRSIRDQCKAANVPFFFKQLSKNDLYLPEIDYKDYDKFPKDLQIRQWPNSR